MNANDIAISDFAIALFIFLAFASLALAAIAGALAVIAVQREARAAKRHPFAALNRLASDIREAGEREAKARAAQDRGDLAAARAALVVPRRFAR